MTNHPKRTLSKAAIGTLRYFQRGYACDPQGFWLECAYAPSCVPSLLGRGFIERSPHPGSSDLYRITLDGLNALVAVTTVRRVS